MSGQGARASWKLEDTRARLGEVVRRAGTEGPQFVTRRGRRAAVVMSAEDFERLDARPDGLELVKALQASGLADLATERDRDPGREPSML